MALEIVLVAAAYLAGSIPTGVLLARSAGVDVRREGSGNIGATNVARTAGGKLGVLTLVGDALKGLVPVLVARTAGASAAAVAAVAVAAIVGHVFSVFLSFRGGKGVATGLGALLGLAPAAVPVALGVFAATFALFRVVSLASMIAAVAAPATMLVLGYRAVLVTGASLIAALILWRHRENIERLWAGTERPFRGRS